MGDGLRRQDKEDDRKIIEAMSYAVQYSSSWAENSDRESKGRSFELEIFALYQMAFGSELYCESPLANEIRKHKDDLSAIVTALQKDDDLYQKARFALTCFRGWLKAQEKSHPEYDVDVLDELREYQKHTKDALEKIEQEKDAEKSISKTGIVILQQPPGMATDQKPKKDKRFKIEDQEAYKREMFPQMIELLSNGETKASATAIIAKKFPIQPNTVEKAFNKIMMSKKEAESLLKKYGNEHLTEKLRNLKS